MASILLGVMVFFYTVYFSLWTIARHNAYSFTSAFDLGIVDQAVWLLSHGYPSYSTLLGGYFFGDHARVILYLLAPLYQVFSDVRVLLIIQSFILALGAIPLYLLALRQTQYYSISLTISGLYLLYPALENINAYDFHPDAIAITAILVAFYFLNNEKWHLFLGAMLVALMCKENISLTFIMLGVYVYFKHNKTVGGVTVLIAIAWFYFMTQLFMPTLAGTKVHSLSRWSQYGDSTSGIVYTAIFHPNIILGDVFTHQNLIYVLQLLIPISFIPLLSPQTLWISSIIVGLNLTSSFDAQHTILYQYNAEIIPILFISMIFGMKWLIEKLQRQNILPQSWLIFGISFVLIAVNIASIKWEHIPVVVHQYPLTALQATEHTRAIDECLKLIPAEASVSADTFMVPHISQRKEIYMFPNPFEVRYYYHPLDPVHHIPPIDYVIVDKVITNDQFAPSTLKNSILNDLTHTKKYQTICEKDGVLLLKRFQ